MRTIELFFVLQLLHQKKKNVLPKERGDKEEKCGKKRGKENHFQKVSNS